MTLKWICFCHLPCCTKLPSGWAFPYTRKSKWSKRRIQRVPQFIIVTYHYADHLELELMFLRGRKNFVVSCCRWVYWEGIRLTLQILEQASFLDILRGVDGSKLNSWLWGKLSFVIYPTQKIFCWKYEMDLFRDILPPSFPTWFHTNAATGPSINWSFFLMGKSKIHSRAVHLFEGGYLC